MLTTPCNPSLKDLQSVEKFLVKMPSCKFPYTFDSIAIKELKFKYNYAAN